jgi:hypothetical protein
MNRQLTSGDARGPAPKRAKCAVRPQQEISLFRGMISLLASQHFPALLRREFDLQDIDLLML